jgi:hypothetical protein
MKIATLAPLAVLCWGCCLLIACGDGSPKAEKDGPWPGGPLPDKRGGANDKKDDGAAKRDEGPRVFVLEIEEENKDALPARLEEHDDDHEASPPFQVLYDQLVIHRERAEVAPLDAPSLIIEPAGTQLSKCKVFVAHAIRHSGMGRVGIDARYFGFAAMPANVVLPAKAVADRLDHDPAKGPLMQALMEIRLFPDSVKQIELRDTGDGKVTVAVGGETKTLAAGESIMLWSISKQIEVGAKAVTSDSVTKSDDLFDPAPPRIAGAKQVVVDAVSYGKVEFGTRVKVTFHGLFPLTTQTPQPKLED